MWLDVPSWSSGPHRPQLPYRSMNSSRMSLWVPTDISALPLQSLVGGRGRGTPRPYRVGEQPDHHAGPRRRDQVVGGAETDPAERLHAAQPVLHRVDVHGH